MPDEKQDAWLMLLERIEAQVQNISEKLDSGAFVSRNEWEERKKSTDNQIEQLRQDTDDHFDRLDTKLDTIQPKAPTPGFVITLVIAGLAMLSGWVVAVIMIAQDVVIR